MSNRLIFPDEAAAILGLSPRTLRQWRWEDRGPRYVKAGGRVRYRESDLDAWVEGRTHDPEGDDGADTGTRGDEVLASL